MAKQIITDEESTLKRQARRRLIGAAALTILVVVLLPMLLDKAPPAPAQDIELKIPDKDNVGKFDPEMVLPPQNALEAATQPASAAVIAPLLNGSAPVAQSSPEAKIETRTVIDVKPVLEAKPVIGAKLAPVTQPRVELKSPPPDSKPAARTVKPKSGFVLQIAAFAHADAANALREKLLKQGFPSYTEKSGNLIRVRIGSYATQAEADKIRRKLEVQGMKPDVVNLN